ncbi:MAG TPA: hypothetical protein VIX73_09900, partial [Kofleriaceae bacterium]
MTVQRFTACVVLGLLGSGAARAIADDKTSAPTDTPSDGETIVIVDHAPRGPGEAARDRNRALGDAPFVTVLHADAFPAAASVADAVATAVGAHTRSLGGL